MMQARSVMVPAAESTVAGRMAEWLSGLPAAGVPDRARDAARRALTDGVGVLYAGWDMPLARMIREEALAEGADGSARVFGASRRLAPALAARVNATAGHVLDFDANFNRGMVFGPAAFFPALFAMAEGEGRAFDGARFLSAFAVGAEIARTLAESLSERPYSKDRDSLFYKGWFNTAVLGPIAIAGACSWLVGLTERETVNALTIAAIQAGGLRIGVGSHMKPLLCGRAAETGLRAVQWARNGVEAPDNAFEGTRGFIQAINAGGWTPDAFDDLGAFEDAGASLKLYPACSSVQAAAEVLVGLLQDNALTGTDLATVECLVTPHIAANLAYDIPENVTQAQFSIRYALGCILERGDFTFASLSDRDIADPAIRAQMDKISMQGGLRFDSPADARLYPEATAVTVTTKDGRRFSGRQDASTGKPVNPMPEAQLQAKFRANVGRVHGGQAVDLLLARLSGLEGLADIRNLFDGVEVQP